MTLEQKKESVPKRIKPDPIVKIVIFTSFIFITFLFSTILIVIFFIPMFHIIHAQFWEEMPCIILKSEVYSNPSQNNDSPKSVYKIQVQYSYNFKGKSYISDRYSFEEQPSQYHNRKDEIVSDLPVGITSKCYVNKNMPEEAVMDRGTYFHLWTCLTPIIFLIGISIKFFIYREKEKSLSKVQALPQFNRTKNKKNNK